MGVSPKFLAALRTKPPTPGPGECWECPERDGRLVCDPAVSRRCPNVDKRR